MWYFERFSGFFGAIFIEDRRETTKNEFFRWFYPRNHSYTCVLKFDKLPLWTMTTLMNDAFSRKLKFDKLPLWTTTTLMNDAFFSSLSSFIRVRGCISNMYSYKIYIFAKKNIAFHCRHPNRQLMVEICCTWQKIILLNFVRTLFWTLFITS